MKLYLVMGCTGEYEDQHSWSVKGYLNKRLAEHHAKRAQQRAYEILCEALNIPLTDDEEVIRAADKDLDRWESIVEKDGINEWDSKFHVSYDRRADYYVSHFPIELDTTPPHEQE